MEKVLQPAEHLLLARSGKHREDERDNLRGCREAMPRDDLDNLDVPIGDVEFRQRPRPANEPRHALRGDDCGRHCSIIPVAYPQPVSLRAGAGGGSFLVMTAASSIGAGSCSSHTCAISSLRQAMYAARASGSGVTNGASAASRRTTRATCSGVAQPSLIRSVLMRTGRRFPILTIASPTS